MMLPDAQCPPVKVMKTELRAQCRGLFGGFMVTGKHVDALAARLENLSAFIEAAGPAHQVAGGEVVVGVGGHQPLERLVIAVDVGKNEQLHGPMIACEAARVAPPAKRL